MAVKPLVTGGTIGKEAARSSKPIDEALITSRAQRHKTTELPDDAHPGYPRS